jgi:hypothetical protein
MNVVKAQPKRYAAADFIGLGGPAAHERAELVVVRGAERGEGRLNRNDLELGCGFSTTPGVTHSHE